MIGKLLRSGIALSAMFAAAACSGQSSPQATGEAQVQTATAEAAIHPLAGQVVGEREGHGDHDAYSPTALASLGGEFELVQVMNGATFTEKDLLGEWALVYFGYMECAEACPIALKTMPVAVDKLNADGIPARAVFVDINAPRLDDETGGFAAHAGHEGAAVTHTGHDAMPRSGPEVRRLALAAWAPAIDDDMIFLSGSRKQVLGANKAYQSRVEAAMISNSKEPIHHINHTTTIYVQDPQGRVLGLAYHSDSVATMVETVKEFAKTSSQTAVAQADAPKAAPKAAAPAPATGHSSH